MSVRQVGSAIKPFIYSAALDSGMMLASLVNDAPINKWDSSKSHVWRPKNSPATYDGLTRLRLGLAQSKNVMAVRVLREVGLENTRKYLTKFGFDINSIPKSETIALGAGSLTPLELAQGYSVFANGGHFVKPHFVKEVLSSSGDVLFRERPKTICREDCTDPNLNANSDFHRQNSDSKIVSEYAPLVISPQTAFLVREMMYSNVWGGGSWRDGTGWNGTGWRGQQLKR